MEHNDDNNVIWYKAQLVAKGYAQTHGIDYKETFSPVAKVTTIQTVIALAATKEWHLHQMDVKSSFLQGESDEEVYMVQPPGFKSRKHPQSVSRFKEPMYNLKQASRAWYSKITQYLHQIGFKMSKFDNSLYIQSDTGGQVFILIYVDDLIIGGEHLADIDHIKKLLSNRFELKDMQELHYFLGINVIRTPNGIMISQ